MLILAAFSCSLLSEFDLGRWWPVSATGLEGVEIAATAALGLTAAALRTGHAATRPWPLLGLLAVANVLVFLVSDLSARHALAGLAAYLAAELLIFRSAAEADHRRDPRGTRPRPRARSSRRRDRSPRGAAARRLVPAPDQTTTRSRRVGQPAPGRAARSSRVAAAGGAAAGARASGFA